MALFSEFIWAVGAEWGSVSKKCWKPLVLKQIAAFFEIFCGYSWLFSLKKGILGAFLIFGTQFARVGR